MGVSIVVADGTFTGGANTGGFILTSPIALFGSNNASDIVADGSTITRQYIAGLGQFVTTSGSFTGTLQNNSAPATTTFSVQNSGSLVLAPAPEPSSVLAIDVGLAGLCTLALAARRRRLMPKRRK